MAEWKATFVSSFQSTTSETSTTQQRCLFPTPQDAGEFHTSVRLKVGGPELRKHREGRSKGTAELVPAIQALWPQQLSPQLQRTQQQQGKECTWLWPPDCRSTHSHRHMSNSSSGAWNPSPQAAWAPMTLAPAPFTVLESVNLTKLDMV